MKLTKETLTRLILEAMNSKLAILKLTVGDVILDIPKGFYKTKDGPDRLNPGHHQIVIVTSDKMKMMDISYDYKTQEVNMNIFVRDPEDKTVPRIFDFRGHESIPAGSPPRLIRQKFYDLMDILKKEK